MSSSSKAVTYIYSRILIRQRVSESKSLPGQTRTKPTPSAKIFSKRHKKGRKKKTLSKIQSRKQKMNIRIGRPFQLVFSRYFVPSSGAVPAPAFDIIFCALERLFFGIGARRIKSVKRTLGTA
jgi:hypothetical protein